MSLKQISTYLSRLAMDDPNSDLFVRIVVPALKGSNSSDEKSQIWFCPFCISNASDKHSFTSYYSFTRHLTSLHKTLLPINGTIFSSSLTSSSFLCEVCERSFSRNEHLQQHFKSRIHLNNESTSNKTKPITKLDLSSTSLSNHEKVESSILKDGENDGEDDDEDGLLKDWINQSEIVTTKNAGLKSSSNDYHLESYHSNPSMPSSSTSSSILLLSSSPSKKDRAGESFSNTDDDDSMMLTSWILTNIDNLECLQPTDSKKREFIKTFRPHKSILKKYKRNNIKKTVRFEISQTSSS